MTWRSLSVGRKVLFLFVFFVFCVCLYVCGGFLLFFALGLFGCCKLWCLSYFPWRLLFKINNFWYVLVPSWQLHCLAGPVMCYTLYNTAQRPNINKRLLWGKKRSREIKSKSCICIWPSQCLHVFTHERSVAIGMELLVSWSPLVPTEIIQC